MSTHARQETAMLTLPPSAAASPRRILATRNAGWARAFAHRLAAIGVRPNAVSIAGIVFAVVGGAAFVSAPSVSGTWRAAMLVAAASCIQLRLLCNLLDGMLAVEEGLKSATGEIYNDLPDRIADVVILVCAGYAVPEIPYASTLGWAASAMAIFTAYVRVLGGSLGLTQHFIGPMAKQHRMFTLTIVTLLAGVEASIGAQPRAIAAGLAVIVVGSIATAVRRSLRLFAEASVR